jgi:hypothetical protein
MRDRLAEKYANEEVHRAFLAFYQCQPPIHKPAPKPVRPGLSQSKAASTKDVPVVPKITISHIREMAKLLDEKISEYELSEMLAEADKDGDGEISEQDFLRVMKRTDIY